MLLLQQIKAARGLLEWSQEDLGRHAGLSKTAITNIESGRFRPTLKSLESIKQAFERSGIEFIEGGVRFSSPTIQVFRNPDFEKKMQDFFYSTCKNQGIAEMLFLGLNPALMPQEQYTHTQEHARRMNDLGVHVRGIVSETFEQKFSLPHVQFRAIPAHYHVDSSPFFIMGPYIGMILYDVQEVVVILNEAQAMFQKNLFEFIWDHARPFPRQKSK